MRQRVSGILAFILFFCVVAYSESPAEKILTTYASGNLHQLLLDDPVSFIRFIGEEPTSYDYYSGDRYLFTYTDFKHDQINALTIIWTLDKGIEEIRLGFVAPLSTDDVLSMLGYKKYRFKTYAPRYLIMRLGNVPYYAECFELEKAVRRSYSTIAYDVQLVFVLDHLSERVLSLMIRLAK